MAGKLISGTYSAGYTLNPNYNSVDITGTGSIGGAGLVISAYAAVTNYGHVQATNGADGITLGLGGVGLVNTESGFIGGGAAKASKGMNAPGGAGGAGVYEGAFQSGYRGFFSNFGQIVGGAGGAGDAGMAAGAGGGGGAGVELHDTAIDMTNSELIRGGAGGAGGKGEAGGPNSAGRGGAGGVGVGLAGPRAYLLVYSDASYAAIYGGAGGKGGYGLGGGAGGAGGDGADLTAGGAINVRGSGATLYYAHVQGGAGGAGGGASPGAAGARGGAGGAGVSFGAYGTLDSMGLVAGGDGGAGGSASIAGAGGVGGDGAVFGTGGFVRDYSVIRGGTGGAGGAVTNANVYGQGGAGGVGLTFGGAGFLDVNHEGIKTGIYGGAGGAGGYGSTGGARGGEGGDGVYLAQGVYFYNYKGRIQGGAGGAGGASGGQGGYGGTGAEGLYLSGAGTVINAGVIAGGAGGVGGASAGGSAYGGGGGTGGTGVILGDRGVLVNKGAIYGGAGGAGGEGPAGQGRGGGGNDGVFASYSTVFNYGTILGGDGGSGQVGIGAALFGTGSIINGSSADTHALIGGGLSGGAQAGVGVFLNATGPVTLTNFGTITGSVAVEFVSSLDALVVEAGCAFIGAVEGAGGALVLASGTGTVAAFLNGDNDVTVSGSMAPTTFQDFASLEIGAGASFTMAAGADAPSGDTLTVAGSLTIASTLSVEGVLNVSGKLAGAKKAALVIDGGAATFGKGTSLTVPTVDVSGAAQVTVATSLTFKGLWDQSAGALTIDKGKTFTFTASGSTFSGALDGSSRNGQGFMTFNTASAGVETFNGVTVSNLVVNVAPTVTIEVGAGGATTTGIGELLLEGTGAGITGLAGSDVLTNKGYLVGAGAIGMGQMGLVNSGVIESLDISGAGGLVINAGAGKDINNGSIFAESTDGVTVSSAIVNNGTLGALEGTFTLDGAVTGSGSALMAGGNLHAASTFNQAVIFTTPTGTLELAHSQAYAATITGFSASGGTYLDLDDIGFVSAGEATFSGTASGGTLTVTDGTHTARIALSGNYLTATFVSAGDGHDGTIIHVMPAPRAPPPAVTQGAPHRLIAAMAALGSRSGPIATHAAEPWRERGTSLAAPRGALV